MISSVSDVDVSITAAHPPRIIELLVAWACCTSTNGAHIRAVDAHHLHSMICKVSDVDVSITAAHTKRITELLVAGARYTSTNGSYPCPSRHWGHREILIRTACYVRRMQTQAQAVGAGLTEPADHLVTAVPRIHHSHSRQGGTGTCVAASVLNHRLARQQRRISDKNEYT